MTSMENMKDHRRITKIHNREDQRLSSRSQRIAILLHPDVRRSYFVCEGLFDFFFGQMHGHV